MIEPSEIIILSALDHRLAVGHHRRRLVAPQHVVLVLVSAIYRVRVQVLAIGIAVYGPRVLYPPHVRCLVGRVGVRTVAEARVRVEGAFCQILKARSRCEVEVIVVTNWCLPICVNKQK